ncbi:MAG: hypothetical protein RJA99_3150 [Pseudomonadota bacterium]|jgi:hypothetical protein
MPIDYKIPLGVDISPITRLSDLNNPQRVMQLEDLRMKVDERNRALAEQDAFKQAMAEANGDLDAAVPLLMQRGLYKQGIDLQTASSNRAKAEREAERAGLESNIKRHEQATGALRGIVASGAAPTDDVVRQVISPFGDERFVEGYIRSLPTRPEDRVGAITWRGATPADLKPQLGTSDAGDQQVFTSRDPRTGGVVVNGTFRKGVSPVEASQAARAEAQIDLARQRVDLERRRLDAPPARTGQAAENKPMPMDAIKAVNEARSGSSQLSAVNEQIDGIVKKIDTGEFQVSPQLRLDATIRNATGRSNANSQQYSELNGMINRFVEESLRLNKGVQTEGDAQRAANAININRNDSRLLKKSLEELSKVNERRIKLYAQDTETIHKNYGRDLQGNPIQQEPAAPSFGSMPPQLPPLPAPGTVIGRVAPGSGMQAPKGESGAQKVVGARELEAWSKEFAISMEEAIRRAESRGYKVR